MTAVKEQTSVTEHASVSVKNAIDYEGQNNEDNILQQFTLQLLVLDFVSYPPYAK